MRKILYRGKCKDNGEWFTGYFVKTNNGICLIVPYINYDDPDDSRYYEVYDETVGEYTGMTDWKGERIFEGDIVRIIRPMEDPIIYKVVYQDCFFLGEDEDGRYDEIAYWNDIEIIGNIHDNPELLEACNG